MYSGQNFWVVFIFIGIFIDPIFSQSSWTITETLDSNGNYNLTRWVDIEESSIEFEVRVETTGFIGFGLSYTGDMVGADIVIGGVRNDNSVYFSDRHATARAEPIVDKSQDWNLISAFEQDGVTTIRFNRTFNSCDNEDIPITEDTLKFIWAFGNTDTIEYHGTTNRGATSVNLLDPPQPNPDMEGLKEWPVLVEDTMPTQETAYWCSIHTTPLEITQKTYLVGFESKLDNIDAEAHTHHFIFSKCTVPNENARQILEDNVDQPGQDCQNQLAKQFCNMNMFVWAKGGQRTMFPEKVGFPILETPDREYYMLEIHYDNPRNISDLKFKTGINIIYGNNREIEAGLLIIGHQVWFPHTIPPNSQNFLTLGQCPSECTNWGLPSTGINIFNTLLHSHLSGRKLKVRHIRDGQELPWISSDDNYDFNYQQNRPVRKELVILPGDHLLYECVTDTTWKNGKLTIGDLATTDEMCESFLFYYPRINMDLCMTTVDTEVTFKVLGIEEIAENPANANNPIITAPAKMANMTYIDALETVVNWTQDLRDEFQRAVRYGDQYYYCGKVGTEDIIFGPLKYLEMEKEYLPENPCLADEESTTVSKELEWNWTVTETLDSNRRQSRNYSFGLACS